MYRIRRAQAETLTLSCAHQDNLPPEEQVLKKEERAHIPVAGSKARPRFKSKDKFRSASKKIMFTARMRVDQAPISAPARMLAPVKEPEPEPELGVGAEPEPEPEPEPAPQTQPQQQDRERDPDLERLRP